jgi:NADPH2:quinone reductase
MRAIICTEYGEPRNLVLNHAEAPHPGDGEVLVQMEAAGLGYYDALLVQGKYQIKRPLPFIPGSEIAGRVVAIGPGVDPSLQGRRIMGISPQGALAEVICMPASACVPVPDSMSSETAAAFIISYCTALHGLQTCGALRPGETVLVLGASGGVGLAAIEVARALGAQVIAAASTQAKLDLCVEHGAALTVNYTNPEWRNELHSMVGKNGIDVVYDPVGGSYSEIALRCLKPGGRFLVVGFASGEIPKIPLNIVLLKQCSIVGVDWGALQRSHPEANTPLLTALVNLVAQKAIKPRASSVYPLEDAPAVLQSILDRQNLGKPVIRM